MPDIQKLEQEFIIRVREAELRYICSALRGLEKYRHDEWYELAERLVRQQRGFHERQAAFLSKELNKLLAAPMPVAGEDVAAEVGCDPGISHEKVAVEIDRFMEKLFALTRGHGNDPKKP